MTIRNGLFVVALSIPSALALADTQPKTTGQAPDQMQQQQQQPPPQMQPPEDQPQQLQPPAQDKAAMIKLPPGAKPLGVAAVEEIRALPEMSGKDKSNKMTQKLTDVQGVDTVYKSERSYSDTVSFFDKQFRETHYELAARVTTPTSTAWTVKRADGTLANAIVRKTSPVTFEIVEVAAGQAEIQAPKGEGQK